MNDEYSELSREDLLKRYGKKSYDRPATGRRSPFKFLDSYDAQDADIFFGRDSEIEELLRHFHSYGQVLIYGESGSGKSSLVQCGLRSRIPDSDALFIALRVHAAGLPSLCHQICDAASAGLGEKIEEPPDSNLVATLRVVREAASRPVVLFFDQFEELFLFHEADERLQFATDLAAIRTGNLNIKVFIGIRQDYLAHLSELEETVEGLFDNRFWLRRMSRENAARAVVKACSTCDVAIADELADSILHRLDSAGHGVELPYLQVVIDRLYRQAVDEHPDHPVITNEAVDDLGDITHILGTFLVEEVAKLPSPDTGRQILKSFVTREATRRTLARNTVSQESAGFGEVIPEDVLDVHLDQLASVRILREVADTESYELRHDALAATVAGWISEVEKELIEVRDNLVNRFKEYEARDKPDSALLDCGFIDYLSVYKQRLVPLLNDELNEYVAASERHVLSKRRRSQLAMGAVVASVVLLVVGGLVAYAYAQKQARHEAEKAKQEAADAKDAAELLLTESYIERGTDEIHDENYARAVMWYHAAYKEAELAHSIPWQESARVLVGAWSPLVGRPFVHDGRINAIEISPDGKTALTGSADYTARLWDIETGMPIGEPLEHDESVDVVAFSPDGTLAATGSWDESARLWDVATGKEFKVFTHKAPVTDLAFSPDGQSLITGCDDGMAIVWDVETGKPTELSEHEDWISAVAFSPHGQTVATASADGTARLWDLATGKSLYVFEHDEELVVSDVAFSPSGEWVLTGSEDGTARFWNVGTGMQRGKSLRHDGEVYAVAFSHDGETALTVTYPPDNAVWLWDAETGDPIGEPLLHDDEVLGASFSPGGKSVLTAGRDLTARIWRIDEEAPYISLSFRHDGPVGAAVFSPDGEFVLTGGWDRTARLWRIDRHTPHSTLEHKSDVNAVAFSPDSKTVATASSDGSARLWDVATGKSDVPELKHTDEVYAIAFSSDGKLIATGCNDDKARLWNTQTGRRFGKYHLIHDDDVVTVAFSPDAKQILTGSADMTAQLWDVATQRKLGAPLQHEGWVNVVAFRRDGEVFVTASDDNTVRLWNTAKVVADGSEPERTLLHRREVLDVAFSPDGNTILTGDYDDTARIWDLQKVEPRGVPLEHNARVNSVAFSPDGKLVVTGSSDNTARLWYAVTGKSHGPPLKHLDEVYVVRFSPDGKTVLTASADDTAKMWDVHSGAPRATMKHDNEVIAAEFSPDGLWVITGSVDSTAGIWRMRMDSTLEPKHHTLQVEVLTCLELDSNGIPRRFSQKEWLERKRKLNALKGDRDESR